MASNVNDSALADQIQEIRDALDALTGNLRDGITTDTMEMIVNGAASLGDAVYDAQDNLDL